MYQKKTNSQNICIILLDCIAITLSFLISSYIRNPELVSFFGRSAVLGVVGSFLLSYLLLFLFVNLNRQVMRRNFIQELTSVIKINACIMIMTTYILFFVRIVLDFSRAVFIIFFIIDTILMLLLHQLFKWYLSKVFSKRKGSTQLMVVTTRNKAEMVMHGIADETHWDYNVTSIALMDRNEIGSSINQIPVVADRDSLVEYCRQSSIDEIYFYVDHIEEETYTDLIETLFSMGITIHMNIDLFRIDIGAQRTLTKVGNFYAVTFAYKILPMHKLMMKRLMDILGALVGIVFTAVLTIFLAPVIKLESKGPVFFAQKRVGKNGRIFKMYKFRTMYQDAEERKKQLMDQNEMNGLMFKMENDPRITKIGKFLRKTSIDEFPQFFNILKGDMSLVGTRPPTLDEFEKYKNYHKKRLSFTPGLTGLWQVSGRNDITDFEEVVKLDVQYIDEWSLGLDVLILLKTVSAVFHGSGAK